MDLPDDPLRPHRHEPNPEPPSPDPDFTLTGPHGESHRLTVDRLRELPFTIVSDCYIVSTGHGTSGPFSFGGVTLQDLLTRYVEEEWSQVEVVSGDGFGNRIFRHEIVAPPPSGPILLAYQIDGRLMERSEGLMRMIVPAERDDALRQVKWIAEVKAIP